MRPNDRSGSFRTLVRIATRCTSGIERDHEIPRDDLQAFRTREHRTPICCSQFLSCGRLRVLLEVSKAAFRSRPTTRLLFLREQTSNSHLAMSRTGQEETHALQQAASVAVGTWVS